MSWLSDARKAAAERAEAMSGSQATGLARTSTAGPSVGAVLGAFDQAAPHLEPAVAAFLATAPGPDATRELAARLAELHRLVGEQCYRVSVWRVMHDPPGGRTGGETAP